MGLLQVSADFTVGLNDLDTPPAGGDAKLTLGNVQWYELEVDAPVGQTFTAGSLDAWRNVGGQLRRVDSLDLTLKTGARFWASGDIQAGVHAGDIVYRTNGVTLSGAGTTLTMRFRALVDL